MGIDLGLCIVARYSVGVLTVAFQKTRSTQLPCYCRAAIGIRTHCAYAWRLLFRWPASLFACVCQFVLVFSVSLLRSRDRWAAVDIYLTAKLRNVDPPKPDDGVFTSAHSRLPALSRIHDAAELYTALVLRRVGATSMVFGVLSLIRGASCYFGHEPSRLPPPCSVPRRQCPPSGSGTASS